MTETDITILSLSEAGRAALAKLAALDALCEQQTRTITLTSERAVKAEKERDEVGIQYAAAQARLRLAMACVATLRDIAERDCEYGDTRYCPAFGSRHGTCDGCRARMALAALDAVPGDALATP